MAKSKNRAKAIAEKRARKKARYAAKKDGQESDYAKKKALQARGKFGANSPFRAGDADDRLVPISPSRRELAEYLTRAHNDLMRRSEMAPRERFYIEAI